MALLVFVVAVARVPGGFGVRDVMGVQRPDRSVSLRDVRDLPVQRAGAVWVYGGHGNPPQRQVGPNTWIGEGYGELAGAVGKTDPSVNPDNPDEVLGFLGKGVPVGQEEGKTAWEIQPDGTVVEVPVPDPEAWVPDPDAVPDAVPDAPPDPGSRPRLRQGLTPAQVFQQEAIRDALLAIVAAGGGAAALGGFGGGGMLGGMGSGLGAFR